MSALMKSVLIHTGTHKTGSTSLQQFCARAVEQLLEDGILYPEAGRPDHASAGHHTLAWSIQQKRGLNALEGWEAVVEEVEASVASQVLLSSEVFETCSVNEIRQIRSFFPNATVQALVFLRDPFHYMVSMYKQYLKSWEETRSFRDFARDKMHLCDYSTLMNRWEQGLGETVIARSFEASRKIAAWKPACWMC